MIDVPVRNRATGRLLPMPTHTPKPGRPPGRKPAGPTALYWPVREVSIEQAREIYP